ncbi:hypothetical protein TNCV_1950531 [Trichonephila clavipes]|nr:hypothetical protein TNCV_1950531 [Trichonephila clavipes]
MRFLSGHGHGHEFVDGIVESQVRLLVLLKTCHAEELMYVKSIVAQSPHAGVVWKLGEWVTSWGVILVT